METKKIGENIYEIPKENKMHVPGRILASEKILKAIQQDKSLEQVKNVAQLKGIQEYSLALADCHQGYGFCIGGVAAFDLDEGVITPGGIGFDINCIGKESRILTEHGYFKKIKHFEGKHPKTNLPHLIKKAKRRGNANILLFMNKKAQKINKIKTTSHVQISATDDHPIFTKNGMKEVSQIKEGEEILLYPFEGVPYKKPKRQLLISEKDIDRLERSFTSKLQIKKKLRELELLPLYSDNEKIPYLLKIMGFLFGDGSISLNKKTGDTQIGFYGKNKDLQTIQKDLNSVGFKASIYSRERSHNLNSEYGSFFFTRTEDFMKNSSNSLALLLHLLGTPIGEKSKQDYAVPEWILKSPLWYKRLFLASLFGAEMSSPKTLTNNKFNLYGLVYSLNKRDKQHGLQFINQISSLLEDFGVRNTLIKTREDHLNGMKSTRFRLLVHGTSENLIEFFKKINYEYNLKKRKLANAAIVWLKKKENVIALREKSSQRAKKMRKEGCSKNQIIETVSGQYVNQRFIERSLYEGRKTASRIAYCFISFSEFVKQACYGQEGFVWDSIESIKKEEYNDFVYDFTMDNEEHNFIANNVVVSNCGVRLLKTNLRKKEILSRQQEIVEAMYKKIPSGVGRGSTFNMTKDQLTAVLEGGAQELIKRGFGTKEDYLHTEEEGKLPADATKVSQRARKRGIGQLGTLGAGNHFLEIQYVQDIFDKHTAQAFGLELDQVVVMIHCGSRGLGHQVASDYIKKMEAEYGFESLPDRELINAPIKSPLGKEYLLAMGAAANFAFANRQLITHWTREELSYLFPQSKVDVLYDVCHNIAKIEPYIINRQEKKVCVHRKGATRSLGIGRKEIPKTYREKGQPVLIPGSMGTASYVLVGSKKAEELTFGSTVHGAGRIKSRSKAIKELKGEEIKQTLHESGIEVKSGSLKSLAEEAPQAYKDIDEVVKTVDELGISRKVARLKPLIVIKG